MGWVISLTKTTFKNLHLDASVFSYLLSKELLYLPISLLYRYIRTRITETVGNEEPIFLQPGSRVQALNLTLPVTNNKTLIFHYPLPGTSAFLHVINAQLRVLTHCCVRGGAP